MPLEIEYSKLTTREIKQLCEASGTRNLTAFMENVAVMDPDALAAVVWVLKKQSDPTFTLEQALDMPLDELGVMFPKAGNAAESTTTSSDPSAPSTTGPQRISGARSKRT